MSFDLKLSNGDIDLSSSGALELVYDNSKLKQDIIKILITKLGENKFHPNYGSKVGAVDIGYLGDQELLEEDLKSSVTDAMNLLIALQKSQSRRQFLTPGERIIAVLNIEPARDTVDPRLYNIFITVQTGKLTSLTESLTVRII